jgi:hypothetical protein
MISTRTDGTFPIEVVSSPASPAHAHRSSFSSSQLATLATNLASRKKLISSQIKFYYNEISPYIELLLLE